MSAYARRATIADRMSRIALRRPYSRKDVIKAVKAFKRKYGRYPCSREANAVLERQNIKPRSSIGRDVARCFPLHYLT